MVAAGLGFTAAWFTVSNQLARQHKSRLAARQLAWEKEKLALLQQLESARRNRPAPVIVEAPVAHTEPTIPSNGSAAEIMERLKKFRLGGPQGQSARQLIFYLESLAQLGTDALPVIRDFLARNADLEFVGEGRGRESLIPASLRLGLFDVLRRIGGPEAESLLGDVLRTTGRGLEVLTVSRMLEEMAPGKYRDIAIASAHELLANPIQVTNPSRLDRRSREHLLELLATLNDTSYASIAQTQVVGADGRIDETALRYLERTMPEQYLSYVQQAYADPRTAPEQKGELVEAVIERAGQSAQANEMLYSMVMDETLPKRWREEAIRELDDEGINEDNPSANDLPIIVSRQQMLAAMRPDVRDPELLDYLDRIARNLANLHARAQGVPGQ
jgi:hypothetical protein